MKFTLRDPETVEAFRWMGWEKIEVIAPQWVKDAIDDGRIFGFSDGNAYGKAYVENVDRDGMRIIERGQWIISHGEHCGFTVMRDVDFAKKYKEAGGMK